MVGGIAGRSVEDLDEGVVMVRVVAEEDAGNDREPVLPGGIDDLVVPALEERRLATVPVIALGVEEVAVHRATLPASMDLGRDPDRVGIAGPLLDFAASGPVAQLVRAEDS